MRGHAIAILAAVAGCSFTGLPPGASDGAADDQPDFDGDPTVIDAPVIDAVVIDAEPGTPDAFVCAGGCDDGNPCTTDTCVTNVGCESVALSLPSGCGGALFACPGETTCYVQCPNAQAWLQGEAACQTWGGHLATVLDDAESACIGATLSSGSRRWIGYYQPSGSPEPDGGWLWVSGSTAPTNTNWASGQPNNPTDQGPAGQDCVFIQGTGGTWYDHECGAVEHGYVCEQ
jgi:hypothetical protein